MCGMDGRENSQVHIILRFTAIEVATLRIKNTLLNDMLTFTDIHN